MISSQYKHYCKQCGDMTTDNWKNRFSNVSKYLDIAFTEAEEIGYKIDYCPKCQESPKYMVQFRMVPSRSG